MGELQKMFDAEEQEMTTRREGKLQEWEIEFDKNTNPTFKKIMHGRGTLPFDKIRLREVSPEYDDMVKGLVEHIRKLILWCDCIETKKPPSEINWRVVNEARAALAKLGGEW